MGEMSSRQKAVAKSIAAAGTVTRMDGPIEKAECLFTDEQLALTMQKVFVWTQTGKEPHFNAPDVGWLNVAVNLRVTFASDAEPPAVLPDQLTDVVRGAYCRAMRLVVTVPLHRLPKVEYAGWRSAALHGYNCAIADKAGMRTNSVAERERMMVNGARATLQ